MRKKSWRIVYIVVYFNSTFFWQKIRIIISKHPNFLWKGNPDIRNPGIRNISCQKYKSGIFLLFRKKLKNRGILLDLNRNSKFEILQFLLLYNLWNVFLQLNFSSLFCEKIQNLPSNRVQKTQIHYFTNLSLNLNFFIKNYFLPKASRLAASSYPLLSDFSITFRLFSLSFSSNLLENALTSSWSLFL